MKETKEIGQLYSTWNAGLDPFEIKDIIEITGRDLNGVSIGSSENWVVAMHWC